MRATPPPDPGGAATLNDVADRLRALRGWAGEPSFTTITTRVNERWSRASRPRRELAGRTTVLDCFRSGRRRLNTDLVLAVVEALHPEPGYVAQWHQVLLVIGGERRAAAQVRAYDSLPPDLPGFTGREADLERLGGLHGIGAIEGMAGAGKTRLAVRAAHLQPYDRVLFVNLRGFHPDPTQPPAEPAAVLDAFLRLLGVAGSEIPHDLGERARLYRERLAGSSTLVVLDNAADAEQVRPLLPGGPVLITSRSGLAALRPQVSLTVGVFSPDEAREFLGGGDAVAADRIAALCGRLLLALGLVAGQIRDRPGWTLSDHADRLGERRRERRLDEGVELALDLSYRRLEPSLRRLLRLLALHPADDFDAYAAAALTGTDVEAARTGLRRLREQHLIQPSGENRSALHDLIRLHAAVRAHDEERPTELRAALSRLVDHYLATADQAMRILRPAGLRDPLPAGIDRPPVPLGGPDEARAWVRTERQAVLSIAADAASRGWKTRVTALSSTLGGYLNSSFGDEAVALHELALRAATTAGDPADTARAHMLLGSALALQSRIHPAAEHYAAARDGFQRLGHRPWHALALMNVGLAKLYLGHHDAASNDLSQALDLIDPADQPGLTGRVLHNLGAMAMVWGRYDSAADFFERAWAVRRALNDRVDEAYYLEATGELGTRLGRPAEAVARLTRSVEMFQGRGNLYGAAHALVNLGIAHTRNGEPDRGRECHAAALSVYHGDNNLDLRAAAHNGLGEAALTSGRPDEALREHAIALDLAARADRPLEQAHAYAGLFRADPARDRDRLAALKLYTELGMPEATALA